MKRISLKAPVAVVSGFRIARRRPSCAVGCECVPHQKIDPAGQTRTPRKLINRSIREIYVGSWGDSFRRGADGMFSIHFEFVPRGENEICDHADGFRFARGKYLASDWT